jgi:RimJ/RimL family protein N-acetyltransferase
MCLPFLLFVIVGSQDRQWLCHIPSTTNGSKRSAGDVCSSESSAAPPDAAELHSDVVASYPLLETRRLLLQPLALDDAPQIQRVFPRWEIVRYLSKVVPWPYPKDGAIAFIRDVALPSTERGESWNWTIRLKTDPAAIVGSIALRISPDKNRGFWLAPEFHRQGLMTEASDAVTDYWFDVLGQPVLRVPKAIVNEGSRRISEKSGMRVVATFERDFVCGRLPAELWEISGDEWRRRRLERLTLA